MSDFDRFQHANTEKARASAEYGNASARLEIATMRARTAELLSQHEPVASLEIDREKVRAVIKFINCGRLE
jgi:hypothetical protein